ncbi:MAG: ricin-type beta-trefoil lectin domain protein [Rhodocyclaceae bacterium]|nr:ricin-type beta-trefoil lectin domain protein [Rhodocyclaceae bacterium]
MDSGELNPLAIWRYCSDPSYDIARKTVLMKTFVAVVGIVGASFLNACWASSVVSRMNGRCLDVPGANIRQGQTLQSFDCNGTVAQQFTWNSRGEIRMGDLCVEAYGGKGHKGDLPPGFPEAANAAAKG